MPCAWSQRMSEIVCLLMLIFVCNSIYPSYIENVPLLVSYSLTLSFLSHFCKKDKQNETKRRQGNKRRGADQTSVCSLLLYRRFLFSSETLQPSTPLSSGFIALYLSHTFSLALPLFPTVLNIYPVLKSPTHTHNHPERGDEFS